MAQGWVALLRGINLVKRNRVAMPALREALAAAGYEDVRTHIQSGNVLFRRKASDRAALVRRLEQLVRDEFGVESTVVLRTFAQVVKVAGAHPFGADTSKTYVTFLAAKPTAKNVRSLAELDLGRERFEVVGSDVYVQLPNGVQGAKLTGALLEKRLGVAGTARNWRTVTRLAELAQEG